MLKKLFDINLNTDLYFYLLLKPTSSDLCVHRRVRDKNFLPLRNHMSLYQYKVHVQTVDFNKESITYDSSMSLNTNRSSQSKNS